MCHRDEMGGVDEDACAIMSVQEFTLFVADKCYHPGPRVGRCSVVATYT